MESSTERLARCHFVTFSNTELDLFVLIICLTFSRPFSSLDFLPDVTLIDGFSTVSSLRSPLPFRINFSGFWSFLPLSIHSVVSHEALTQIKYSNGIIFLQSLSISKNSL